MKNPIFVMPARIAGIQARKEASGDIHVNLIPALHAGMTQSTDFPELTEALRRIFIRRHRERGEKILNSTARCGDGKNNLREPCVSV